VLVELSVRTLTTAEKVAFQCTFDVLVELSVRTLTTAGTLNNNIFIPLASKNIYPIYSSKGNKINTIWII
jgi:hypothetical protein